MKKHNTRTVSVIGTNKKITFRGPAKLKKPIKGKGETKDKTKPKLSPRFDNGTIIRDASLVTDCNGVSWWVDPSSRTVSPLEVPAA